jgi:hypothetical protein
MFVLNSTSSRLQNEYFYNNIGKDTPVVPFYDELSRRTTSYKTCGQWYVVVVATIFLTDKNYEWHTERNKWWT